MIKVYSYKLRYSMLDIKYAFGDKSAHTESNIYLPTGLLVVLVDAVVAAGPAVVTTSAFVVAVVTAGPAVVAARVAAVAFGAFVVATARRKID